MTKSLWISFLLAMLCGSVSAQRLPPTEYQGPVYSAAIPDVRSVKPIWTLAVDVAGYGEQAVLVSGDRVLVKIDGTLQARELATGKTVWTMRQPGHLQTVTSQVVLTTSKDALSAYRLRDGRQLWTQKLSGSILNVGQSNGVMYVTTDRGGSALDAETGQVRWSFAASEMSGFRQETDGVVFWDAYQGEPHFPAVYAFDAKTGKQLYRLGGTVGPLGVRNGEVLMADATYLGEDGTATVRWLGRRTGTVKQTLKLAADFQCPGTDELRRSGADTFYVAPHAYVVEQCGARARQFWIDRPGRAEQVTETAMSPDRTFAAPGDSRYRAGPVGGLLVLEDRAHAVRLIRTSGGAPVSLNGVQMPTGMGRELPGTGPVSRLDALGDTLYLGRTTGSLLAYDLKNTKARYAVRLPWSGFGPSLRSGEYVVLTTPGQVAVVHEAH